MPRRKSHKWSDSNKVLLDTLIQRHAAKPSAKPAPAQRPAVAQRSADGTKVARALERHLQTAILDPAARERLVRDAMRLTGGDRSAAIRVVLHDLLAEDRRFS